jgi:hypothetical protein
MFKLDPDANTQGTSYLTEIELAPRRLVDLFGQPEEPTETKLSGLYTFTNEAGDVFTVYDWKATSRYYGDDDGSWPTPEEFWSEWQPVTLNIGGRDDSDEDAFTRWLIEQLT